MNMFYLEIAVDMLSEVASGDAFKGLDARTRARLAMAEKQSVITKQENEKFTTEWGSSLAVKKTAVSDGLSDQQRKANKAARDANRKAPNKAARGTAASIQGQASAASESEIKLLLRKLQWVELKQSPSLCQFFDKDIQGPELARGLGAAKVEGGWAIPFLGDPNGGPMKFYARPGKLTNNSGPDASGKWDDIVSIDEIADKPGGMHPADIDRAHYRSSNVPGLQKGHTKFLDRLKELGIFSKSMLGLSSGVSPGLASLEHAADDHGRRLSSGGAGRSSSLRGSRGGGRTGPLFSGGGGGLTPRVSSDMRMSRGESLSGPVRSQLEGHFGRSLADVRVHTDRSAAEAAKGLNARAFTMGSHVYFGAGQFNPKTPGGMGLLGHEIAHVDQFQRGLTSFGATNRKDASGGVANRLERFADDHERRVRLLNAGPSTAGIASIELDAIDHGDPAVGEALQRIGEQAAQLAAARLRGSALEASIDTLKLVAEVDPLDEAGESRRVAHAIVAKAQAAAARLRGAPRLGGKLHRKLHVGPHSTTEDGKPVYGPIIGEDKLEEAWQKVQHELVGLGWLEPGTEREKLIKERLARWIRARGAKENKDAEDKHSYTEERTYEDWHHLARALYGDVLSDSNLLIEKELAKQVREYGHFEDSLDAVLLAIAAKINAQPDADEIWAVLEQTKSRYGKFYPNGRVKAFMNNPSSMEGALEPKVRFDTKVILIDEFFATGLKGDKKKGIAPALKNDHKVKNLDAEHFGDYRYSGWTVKEQNKWVEEARANGMPLWAGPSGTTNQVLQTALHVGAGDLEHLAWCMFSFFNLMWTGQSATHRFHEVMDVARLHYGVPYERFKYPGAPPGKK